MATSITITFANSVNSSIQIGDSVYYSTITNGVTDAPTEVGSITAFTNTTVTCNIDPSASTTGLASKFFFFAKDNKANLSSLVGYYAEVVMKNDSTDEIELFQIGSDISESSKS
jgi:hypothetical protein|tara:strand:- start:286 stop:627 length:342 start_codon:yes stop_codon:yes gene_type:complete